MQVSLDDYVWGAGVATDLVNTAPGVWSGVDKLPEAAALDQFLHDHQVVPVPPDEAGSDALTAVRRLRDAARLSKNALAASNWREDQTRAD